MVTFIAVAVLVLIAEWAFAREGKAQSKPYPDVSWWFLKKVKSEPVDPVIFKPFKLNDFQSTIQGGLAPRYGEQGIMRVL